MTTKAEQIKFYKNGRINVKFKDSTAIRNCFDRLRLGEITLRSGTDHERPATATPEGNPCGVFFVLPTIIKDRYAIIPQQIPQGKRAEVNEKILFAINSGKELIPAESIYNCNTGVGGLHNLRQSDFASYHEYAQAKKEFEMGQFFTPHEICREMADVLSSRLRSCKASSGRNAG